MPHGLKHDHSIFSDDATDSDEEALTLSEVLQTLYCKYPRLDLPQYMPLFEKEKIIYAETILKFDWEYLVQLGIAKGAVDILMAGVQKVLHQEKKERKRARHSVLFQRGESVEI